jgi:transglycosylase-like protein with SLT domain
MRIQSTDEAKPAVTRRSEPHKEPAKSRSNTRLVNAIIGAESGGRNVTNRDSGALGIGQIMPRNVRAWSREALGHEISPQTFKQRPDLQRKIIDYKLNQYYREGLRATGGNEREAIRYAAAKWYSGDGNRRNDTHAQRSGARSYPSIASYSNDALRRYLSS